MFAVVYQFLNKILECLIILLFFAIGASLEARMLALIALFFDGASWHAFEAFHI